MNTSQPIREWKELENLKKYYKEVRPQERNQLLLIMGLNTALRISDLLSLRWSDVYNFEKKTFKTHIVLLEQKTGKVSNIYLNHSITEALMDYRNILRKQGVTIKKGRYLYRGKTKNVPLSRVQAFRIIKEAADYCEIKGNISCHSLRKTFGYHAWKQGASPVLLMNIFNHSSYRVTKHYLGIEQDDRDTVFEQIVL